MYQQVSQLVTKELQFLEGELNRYLASQNPLISQISKHICESGGKRIRPLLVLLCCRLCGYPKEDAVVYASVVEFVHTATLLHDDVIDEATTRRGAPSANARWGNSIPVLVGDYLFSVSNALLVEKRQPRILGAMADTVKSIVDGELWEVFKRRDFDTTEEDYFSIISKKTATLFAFCCQIGAILGEKGNSHEQALANFGLNLGIAFQVVDDLLDLTSHSQKLGKPVGNDLREGNLTLPLIYLLKSANPREVERIQQIVQNMNGSSADVDYVHQLLDRYDISRHMLQTAAQFIQRAKEDLSVFDDSVFYQALLTLSDYVVQREA